MPPSSANLPSLSAGHLEEADNFKQPLIFKKENLDFHPSGKICCLKTNKF